MKYRPFWCNINHKFKNIDHLSKMVDYRPMVNNIDSLAALLTAYGAPQRPSQTQEKAQTYCPRRVLAGSNLDQVWSTIFGPPGRLTVTMAILGDFWPFFWHKWFKMTWSRWAARWSRSNSTPMSAPVSQFSPKDNFLNPPPLKHTVLRLAKYAKSPKSNMAV